MRAVIKRAENEGYQLHIAFTEIAEELGKGWDF